ncbi:MAG: fimbria/pilus outer membrane usher protein [Rhizomicrobium sp.]
MSRWRLGLAGVLIASLSGSGAWAEERQLLLEVILNGRATGQVGRFIDRNGKLYATPADLRDLGFVVARGPPENEPILLSSLPGVQAAPDEARQTLTVTAPDAALAPTQISHSRSAALAPLTPSAYGALLNYDILGTFTGQENTASAYLGGRVFSPYGLLEGTAIVNATPLDGESHVVRLDTTYTYTEADAMRRWRAGDVITGALPWSRAVRLLGVQVASDFSIRPDLITYPLPAISSSAAVPSTVNVLVDGVRQYSEAVQPGPFTAQALPVVTGAGEVVVAVQDALGRQTLVSLPFYVTAALLKPGLASYSFEAGTVRRNYGLANDAYIGWASNGTLRYGLTDWLTLEAHGEATGGLGLLGAGATVQLGTIGVATAALAASSGHGGLSPIGDRVDSGALVSLGFQRISRDVSVSLSATLTSPGYRDLAAVNGASEPSSTVTASVGYQAGDWGNINVAYVRQRSRAQQPGFGLLGSLETPQADLATISYSVPIAGRFTLYATGFDDLVRRDNFGAGIGISFQLGTTTSAAVGATMDNDRYSGTADISKPALVPDDWGYRLQDSEGASQSRTAEGEYLGSFGRLSAGISQTPGEVAGRVGARGALTLINGGLFASDRIDDSFAVVQTGDVADVPVLYENRFVGKTDSSGQILVPFLLSYQNNRLALDVSHLPADVAVGETARLVRPPDRSGVVVNFGVKNAHAALLKIQDGAGQPIPIGSIARLAGTPDGPVGFGGEAYLMDLKPTNEVDVERPDGTHCKTRFDYRPVAGDIPVIGPLVCR